MNWLLLWCQMRIHFAIGVERVHGTGLVWKAGAERYFSSTP